MADLSLTDMLYYILEYTDAGMPLGELQAELAGKFGWDGTADKLESELKAKAEFCCEDERWKVS